MPESDGNAIQVRVIAEQVAEAALTKFSLEHPEIRRTEVPAPLKWAGGIVAALMSTVFIGMVMWLVSTVNDMQVTMARVDERLSSAATNQSSQYDEMNRRVTRLEAYHAADGK